MTDTTDIAVLREAAMKATPGPWSVARDGSVISNQYHPLATVSDGFHRLRSDGETGQDAEFIALANPATILSLLDQLEAERQRADANAQEIRRLEFQWEHRAPTQWAYDQACTALHAQRERAEKAEAEIAALKAKMALKSEKLADCESALDKAQTLLMPDGLHENTKALVIGFANAMAAKLYKSEQKYGWSDAWLQDDWQDKCLADFNHHISKGDPLDVANYCMFMHYHGWPTTTIKVNNIDALETHTRCIEEALIAATDEIAALKAKLANPVVLPAKLQWSDIDGVSDDEICAFNNAITACASAISQSGFTVKGE